MTVTVCTRAATSRRQVRPSGRRDGGLAEERVIRDMHPLTGQRLDLWRLKNFDGTRLPSAEDTYLFHVVAKDNPTDERLVALAEIRDVDAAAGRGRRGHRLPGGGAAADRLPRRHAAGAGRRGGGGALDANRIFLYVWPTIEVPLDELGDLRAGDRAADGRCRPGGDRDPGPAAGGAGRGAAGRGAALLLPARAPASACGDRAADRADARRWTTTPRRCGAPAPAAPSTPTSWSRWSPGRAAPSSSTTWTTTAGWRRSTGRRATTRPASSPAWSRRRPTATPRA